MGDELRARLRKFGLGAGGILLLMATVMFFRDRRTGAMVTSSLGSLFILAALVAPRILEPVERLFIKVGGVLGWSEHPDSARPGVHPADHPDRRRHADIRAGSVVEEEEAGGGLLLATQER